MEWARADKVIKIKKLKKKELLPWNIQMKGLKLWKGKESDKDR